jgi:ribonuclease HI
VNISQEEIRSLRFQTNTIIKLLDYFEANEKSKDRVLVSDVDIDVLDIWTDGGCKPAIGLGGWAWSTSYRKYDTDFEYDTTNNRMEVFAAIEAIKAFPNRKLCIHTDSEYLILVSKPKCKAKKNLDLVADLQGLCKSGLVSFEWVKAHSGDEMNNFVDDLCTKSMLRGLKESKK